MNTAEVKAFALARAIKTLADLGATYNVEMDGATYSNRRATRQRVLDWSRYRIDERLTEAKAGDILEFHNDGDSLQKLQSRVCSGATQILGSGGYKSEQDVAGDRVVLYVFASPVLEDETEEEATQ